MFNIYKKNMHIFIHIATLVMTLIYGSFNMQFALFRI